MNQLLWIFLLSLYWILYDFVNAKCHENRQVYTAKAGNINDGFDKHSHAAKCEWLIKGNSLETTLKNHRVQQRHVLAVFLVISSYSHLLCGDFSVLF